ncbi:MAG: transcriptional repressor [Bifidobacterium tibiigranuli]|jgi:Fur family ferric uptake transcriptional regulator|nr:transcriptional repressor [Bifidobacterium tibiigranuli]
MPTMQRVTRARMLIVKQLQEDDTFATAQTVYNRLFEKGRRVGIATVYRNLQIMAQDGELDSVRQNGEVYYRLCRDRHHHHHVVCRRCGRAVELEIPGLEQWVNSRAQSLGFSDVTHSIEIFGLCAQCRKLEKREATDDDASPEQADILATRLGLAPRGEQTK